MSESNTQDNPEAEQATEIKNGEQKEECSKEPGQISFLDFCDQDKFLWPESCKKQCW